MRGYCIVTSVRGGYLWATLPESLICLMCMHLTAAWPRVNAMKWEAGIFQSIQPGVEGWSADTAALITEQHRLCSELKPLLERPASHPATPPPARWGWRAVAQIGHRGVLLEPYKLLHVSSLKGLQVELVTSWSLTAESACTAHNLAAERCPWQPLSIVIHSCFPRLSSGDCLLPGLSVED